MIFGIFPVTGLRHRDSSRLSFKLRSFAFIYSLLVQCGMAIMFSTSIYKQLNSRIEYTKVGERLFLVSDRILLAIMRLSHSSQLNSFSSS